MQSSPETLFDLLTLNEKISLLSGKSMWTLRDIKRVGLPSILMSDGPQGVRKAVTELTAIESFPATCFPTACALACSWNRNLVEEVGKALAKECRQQGVNILLGPGMNIKRHPCGGRNFEYFSEDPVVSGHMAAAMVNGIQSSGHVGACIKHLCVNNQESWRFRVNVLVDERSLREIYLKGFEYVVKHSNPWTIMCAYNQVNGIFCSENSSLFQDIVRKEWGYTGHIVTDWGATNRRTAGIEAGVDLEMPGTYGIHDSLIKKGLKEGTLSQDRFDEAVMRNLRLIHRAVVGMETGDNTGDNQLPAATEELYERHHEMAYQAALDCVVLLQNTDNILPLHSKQTDESKAPAKVALIGDYKVALVGDFCRDPRYQGMGSSKVNSTKVDTVLEHISKHVHKFTFSRGYYNSDDDEEDDGSSNNSNKKKKSGHKSAEERKKLIEEAVEHASGAEAVIVMAGVPEIMESEGFDREHINLPAQHNELISRVCEVNSNVIVVLSNGGAVAMPWKDKVKGIVECHLLGQAGARALLDILFGIVSPSGKLTETFPLSLKDVPSDKYFPGNSHTVEYREGLNVGYRYYDTVKAPVLFPFGHGLSYASFDYNNCSCKVIDQSTEGNKGSPLVMVECTITNTGTYSGAEIVQLYVHHDNVKSQSAVFHPEQQLQDFAKTKVLKPNESEQIVFNLAADAFSLFDTGTGEWIIEEGAKYEVRISASSRDVRWTGTVESSAIARTHSSILNIAEPSQHAKTCHPPLQGSAGLSHPLVVSISRFQAMLDTDRAQLMHLSSRTLLGQHVQPPLGIRSTRGLLSQVVNPETAVLPHNIEYIHRNSFLSEIEGNGYFGKMFAKVILKTMEQELEDPNDAKQKKMMREVARNLPLRCLATFSKGALSFELLDSLIAFFNGQYGGAISHLSTGTRKAASSVFNMKR